ncbi:hypothetical protein GCM10011571_03800 [Marinithermofilum abyssi]|jgi:hypothetical protein|uniref:MazG-like family protein n=1 Tax=Marinithermofilum abyssi TaxID=1571185 RepID=A0A8J2VFZ6_9BACL|nr:MazG-like family protein [Marinithermofilum abyssi]GGE05929.1 hypothetical protein GCM10011571_03800 [Marinithermofilum abyssi]
MSRPERNVQIAKSVKVIEWLKTELLDQIANLFKGLHHANQTLIADSLASLIIVTYVLARRVGLTFREVDQSVTRKLREHARGKHQLEDWYGDLSRLEEYINKR